MDDVDDGRAEIPETAATGSCPILRAAGEMGGSGVIRNGKWGLLKRATLMEEMPLGKWKESEILASSLCLPSLPLPSSADASPSAVLCGHHLAREFGNVVSFDILQKGQGVQRMDWRAKR